MTEPPPLEDDNALALRWYAEHATAFVQEFGLMGKMLDALRMTGDRRRLFLARLGRIHETVLKMRAAEMEKRSK